MGSELRFSKYEGAGNDFVMVSDPDDDVSIGPEIVAALCDRRFGIGGDGLIRVVRTDDAAASWFMDYRNADGSDAEMCGNGIRCVGAFLREIGAELADAFAVRTRAGVKQLRLEPRDTGRYRVTVGMGVPNLTKAGIPMRGPAWQTFLEQPFDLGGGLTVTASAVSMGNPHLVLFVDEDPDRYHVGHIGSAIERDERFPEGVNVEFTSVRDGTAVARVWERGSGETMACGSGACAIAVAANEAGLVGERVTVRFPGGDLEVHRAPGGEVELTGDATHVFDGATDLDALIARAS
jgi:diaminopimelate epimerase